PGKISYKSGLNDLVTEVDKQCEEIIVDIIKKHFPDHSILAEESGGNAVREGVLWVIDPIDGTTNYAHSFPFFCTSIGVMVDNETQAGVVYDPSRDELFVAEKNGGSFLNDKRLNVSTVSAVKSSLVATGFAYHMSSKMEMLPYFRCMLHQAQAVRRAGSAALDLCYVACGRFDGFWEFKLNPWDTVAGELIVRRAGGRVTTLDGSDYDIFKKTIVATNGKVHKEILGLLNSVQN
ncbi:MAG: inositol monophosphatase, partial [Candidatus Omnitrophica bacterium]|nr:inositol monophosphatase [Candidatus Omnitrophota bacterium]